MYDDNVRKLKEELIVFVNESFPKVRERRVFDKLIEYIEAKVDAAIRDLDDKINERGVYDPDY